MKAKTKWTKLLLAVLLVVVLAVCATACSKTFTVTFDSNGGSAVGSVEVKSNGTVEEPNAPTRTGYTFEKWVKPDGTEFVFGTDTVTGNITLTATWRVNSYTVTFNTNGGSQVASQSVNHNGTASMPSQPTKAGQVFVGWYEDSDFSTPFDFSKKIVQDTTVYARFVDEIEEIFTVKFVGSSTPVASRTTNEGGVLTDLPAATSADGKEFLGWWMSDFEDESKLTARYTGQVLTQNITLFAVFESDAPAVSVNENGAVWDSMGVNMSYRVTITKPDNTTETPFTTGALQYDYDFASKPAGEYKIEVTCNNKTTTVYYNNKALARVSLFEVNGFELQFNGVANAQKYLITVECGNTSSGHVSGHNRFDNGTSTVFDFSMCEMREEGITFKVEAVADGYITSYSETFVFERRLDAVTGLTVNEADETLSWNDVANAEYYEYKINDGDWTRFNRTVSLKEMGQGDIVVSVRAVAHGYNSSEPAVFTYSKTRLATPVEITVDGDVLSWNTVADAVSYTVNIDGTEHLVETGNTLKLPENIDWTNMQISVRANGATEAENSLYSDVKKFAATLEGKVYYENGQVVWSSIVGAMKYGVKVNDGEEISVESKFSSQSIEFTRKGKNTVSVRYYDNVGAPSKWETIEVEVFAVSLSYNFEYQGDFATLYRAAGDDLELPGNVTFDGYTFRFWSAEKEGLEYIETTLNQASDLTLYAQWEPNTYHVKLTAGGGTIDGSSETVQADVVYRQKFTLPVLVPYDVTKAFEGWYTSTNGNGVKMTDNYGNSVNVWTSLNDITLYPAFVDVLQFALITNPDTGEQEYAVMKAAGISLVTEVTIPSEYNGLPVGEIAGGAFDGCSTLVTINVPDTIRYIDMGLGGNQTGSPFRGCSKLQNVNVYEVEGNHERFYASVDGVLFYKNTITGGVELKYFPYARSGAYTVPFGTEVIPANVFRGYTKITEIYIPASVRQIDTESFYGANKLEKLVFLAVPDAPVDEVGLLETAAAAADNLTLIANCFKGCTSLTEVTLPVRLSSFDILAFSGCTSLEAINVEDGCAAYASVDGMLTDANKSKIIKAPEGMTVALKIPTGILTVGESAFENCKKITSITVPGWVTLIEKNAFKSCTGVTAIVFEGEANDLALTIGEGAFYGCKASTTEAISEITLPANLKSLGKNAFGNISTLTKVVVNSIGEVDFVSGAFATITSSATSVGTTYVTVVELSKDVYIADIGGVFGIKLASVVIAEGNPYYTAIDDIVYDVEITRIIFYPSAKQGAYTTPETVTTIGEKVFTQKTGLTEITIGKNVTEIGSFAFNGCTNLEKVTFADGGTEGLVISNEAFANCSKLAEVNLPVRLVSISAGAFRSCRAITEIVIPEGVESIGAEAFQWCSSLVRVSLPKTLSSLGYTESGSELYMYVFRYCNALEEINVASDNASFYSDNGVLYGKTEGVVTDLYPVPVNNSGVDGVVTIPATLTKVWAEAFKENTGLLKVDFGNVTGNVEFGAEVFYNCKNLTEVVLPDGIELIGKYMFYQCNSLTEITIPNTVKAMEQQAFYYCSQLSKVTFAEGNDSNGLILTGGVYGSQYGTSYYPVFDRCDNLTQIAFPKRLETLGAYALCSTNISQITFSEGGLLTEIGQYALSMSGISSVVIPASVVTIGDYAFSRCTKLTSVTFAADGALEIINSGVFQYTGVNSVVIPANVTRIGNTAFAYSSLKSVTFAEGSVCSSIGYAAFRDSLIESIAIPASVENIGEDIPAAGGPLHGYAFDGCRNLKSLTFDTGSKLKNIYNYAFRNTALTKFSFPSSENEITVAKQLFFGCSELTEIYISESVKSNLDKALAGMPSLEKLEIAATNDSYKVDSELPLVSNQSGDSIFYFFTALDGKNAELVIPEGTYYIGDNAFKNQVDLTKVTIPSSVLEIGEGAFQNCFSLKTVVFAESSSMQSIGKGAFAFCTSLESIVNLPGNASYGTYMFQYCTSLTQISIPAGVTALPNYMFRYCTSLAQIALPESVTSIGQYAFQNCTSLAEIDISNVTSIGNFAFNFSGLTKITIPEAIKTLGNQIFNGCSKLKTVTLHDNITSFGTSLFTDCTSLESITLPSGLKTFGTSVFKNCTSLTSITIPSGVTTLTNNLFDGCTSLASVTLHEGITAFGKATFARCTSLQSIVIPAGITKLSEESLFDGCTSLSSVTLPEGLTALGKYTFRDCTSLTQITLPSSLTFLGTYTFQNSGLTSITIPENVQHIGATAGSKAGTTTAAYVFQGCVNLRSVTLPSGLLSMGAYVFSGCEKLEKVTYTGYDGDESFVLPDSVYVLGNNLFEGCASLTSVVLPSGNGEKLSIGIRLFMDCTNLKTVTFPESGWTKLYNYMFQNCTSLESIVIPDTVTASGTFAFDGCTSLSRVTLPQGMTSISSQMFRNCVSLKSINLPAAATAINTEAFLGSGLEYIVIPQNVKTIGNKAFGDCFNLVEVLVDGLNATFRSEDGIVYNKTTGALVFVPCAMTDIGIDVGELLLNGITAYAFYGVTGIEHITVPEGVTTIPANAFYGFTSLKSVSLPSTLKSIGDYAFAYCTSLESITLPDSIVVPGSQYIEGSTYITILGKYLFQGCTSLSSVTLPEGLDSLNGYMFEGCTALTTIDLPDSLVYLGYYTFRNSGLTSIEIPSGVKYLGYNRNSIPTDSTSAVYLFDGCANLVSVTLPEGLEAIGGSAFSNCPSLQTIVLPSTLYSINKKAFEGSGPKTVTIPAGLTDWDYAFQNCTYLETVTMAEGVTEIPSGAFQNCTSLKTVNLSKTVLEIGMSAFSGCTSLADIELHDSLAEIGMSAFANCTSIKSLVIYPGTLVGSSGTFSGWTAEQTIYIMESRYVISQYWYGATNSSQAVGQWFKECDAQIVYGYTPK